MAHALNLCGLAEGVETNEQRALLSGLGYVPLSLIDTYQFVEYHRKQDGLTILRNHSKRLS